MSSRGRVFNLCEGDRGVFVVVKLCSSISISGDLMTGREPHIRNELSAVVTIEHSSLEVTIWWVCYREREGREGEVYARWCVCVCVCVEIV